MELWQKRIPKKNGFLKNTESKEKERAQMENETAKKDFVLELARKLVSMNVMKL